MFSMVSGDRTTPATHRDGREWCAALAFFRTKNALHMVQGCLYAFESGQANQESRTHVQAEKRQLVTRQRWTE